MKILNIEKNKVQIELTFEDIKYIVSGLISNQIILEAGIHLEEDLDSVMRSHSHTKDLIGEINTRIKEFKDLEDKLWEEIIKE